MSHSRSIDPAAEFASAGAWDALLSAALPGTEGRAGASFPTERAVLNQIALYTAARRAGFVPLAQTTMPLPPAPAESRSPCSYETAVQLNLFAANTNHVYRLVTDTAILTLAERGKRLHPIALTAVMRAYTRYGDEVLRPLLGALRSVFGERGRWLAEQNVVKNAAGKLYADQDTALPFVYADDDDEGQTERNAIAALSQSPAVDVADKAVLMQRRRVWSESLRRVVLGKVERSIEKTHSGEEFVVLMDSLPMYPADMLLQIQARMEDRHKGGSWLQHPLNLIGLILPLYQQLEQELKYE